MASGLTLQDKLALALTSAGSVAELARRMGTSRSTTARWLREGHQGGVKRIPGDEFTRQGIDAIYRQHVRDCNRQSKAEGIPGSVPIFLKRPWLKIPDPKTGERVKGQRLIVDHTMYIRNELRTAIVRAIHKTGAYVSASVQSIIDLALYNQAAQARYQSLGETQWNNDIESNKAKDAREQIRKYLADQLKSMGRKQFGLTVFNSPIYTKMADIRADSDIDAAVNKINSLLRERHEPATGNPGTAFQTAFLFQLATPRPQNDNIVSISTARKKRARSSQGKTRR